MLCCVLITHAAAVQHWWLLLPDLVFFPLHIKACLRCVLARFSPGGLYGNLAPYWTKLNWESVPFTDIRMNAFTVTFIRQKYCTFSSRSPKIWTSSGTTTLHILNGLALIHVGRHMKIMSSIETLQRTLISMTVSQLNLLSGNNFFQIQSVSTGINIKIYWCEWGCN